MIRIVVNTVYSQYYDENLVYLGRLKANHQTRTSKLSMGTV